MTKLSEEGGEDKYNNIPLDATNYVNDYTYNKVIRKTTM